MPRKIIPNVIHDQTVVHLSGDASVQAAAKLMHRHNVGAILIIDAGVLNGIVTVADIAYRVVAQGCDPCKMCLWDIMTKNPDTVSCNTTSIDALRLMQDGGYRHLPVLDGETVVGVVSRRDFFGMEKARLEEETALWERIG